MVRNGILWLIATASINETRVVNGTVPMTNNSVFLSDFQKSGSPKASRKFESHTKCVASGRRGLKWRKLRTSEKTKGNAQKTPKDMIQGERKMRVERVFSIQATFPVQS